MGSFGKPKGIGLSRLYPSPFRELKRIISQDVFERVSKNNLVLDWGGWWNSELRLRAATSILSVCSFLDQVFGA